MSINKLARKYLKFMNGGDYAAAVDRGFPFWSIDPRELEMGIKDEMEEHGMDRETATKTALDHLVKYPTYYSRLKKAGL